MYKHLFGDNLRRVLWKKKESVQIIYKSLACESSLSFKQRCFFRRKLFKQGKKLAMSKIKNYCLITGRSRGILRKFRLSRTMSKTFLSKGFFSGYRRASW